MKIFDYIKDDTIVITPSNVKLKILEEINKKDKILNLKFFTLDDIKKYYCFDYDNKSLLFIMDNYKLNKDISKNILNLLYLIEDKNYNNEKLTFLKEIKKELINNELLFFNEMFKKYLKNKNIICYGYTKIDKFSLKILKEIDCKIIDNLSKPKKRSVYLFSTLEDEVEFVYTKISELIDNGIQLNKIKLCVKEDKYFYTLKRYSKIFNIPIFINNDSIYSSMISKVYLNELKQTKSFLLALDKVKTDFDLTKEQNMNIYSILFDISNKYNDLSYSFNNIYELVVDDIKKSKLKEKKLNNQLEIVDIENNVFDDEYVFLLGFNQGNIPNIYKDEEYLSDIIKEENNIFLETTVEKNVLSKNSIISSINNIENLIITAKERSIDSDYMISNLASELEFNVEKYDFKYEKSYSKNLLEIKLSKYLDDFIKYGIIDKNLVILHNNIETNYLTYSNRFTGIDNKILLKKLKNGLTLSYTHIDSYYHCAFKYYLTNILKLDKYEENFNTLIGSLFHYILSICFNEDFDFNYEYDKYILSLEISNMERFFLTKLKTELKIVIERIKKLHEETGLTKLLLEHKITIDKSSIIPVKFTGIVDKILYKEKENTLVSIVDYKTGHTTIDLYNVLYGLSMQLPVYLYLVKKSNLFNNVRFTGFYLQQILSSEVSFIPNKTYLEQKYNNLKLDGYSNSDPSILEVFIPDYENSKFVKSMKTTSKGFYNYAKVLSDEQIENLIKIVDEKIDLARDKILNGEFDINPKQIGEEKLGCNYCKFKDICFKTNNDYVKLQENKSLSFLGGETDA